MKHFIVKRINVTLCNKILDNNFLSNNIIIHGRCGILLIAYYRRLHYEMDGAIA